MKDNLNIIEAWKELNKINNDIELLEGIVKLNNPKFNKLKDLFISCSTSRENKFIDSISSDNEDVVRLKKKYFERNLYENYIYKEMERVKLSDIALAILFLKDYKKLTWEKIAYLTNYSEKQVRRIYMGYKNKDDQK